MVIYWVVNILIDTQMAGSGSFVWYYKLFHMTFVCFKEQKPFKDKIGTFLVCNLQNMKREYSLSFPIICRRAYAEVHCKCSDFYALHRIHLKRTKHQEGIYSAVFYLLNAKMEIGIRRSIPRMLNWASDEYQLEKAVGSGHAVSTPPVSELVFCRYRLQNLAQIYN